MYSIGPIIGSLMKPKYRIINTVLGEDFNPGKGIDVFIDLNTLISALSSAQKFMRELPFSENVETDIISNVLYMVKHWKDFMKKYENYRIFLIYNSFEMTMLSEQETLKSYLLPYVHKFENDRFKQFVYYWNESMKRVGIILKYIPNVYLLCTNRFDSFVVPNVVDDYKTNGRKRLILTGNPLMTNYTYMENTYVMYTRYRRNAPCQISDPLMIVQSVTSVDDDIMTTFIKNKVFYNLMNSIVGDFDRGIIGLSQLGISTFATNLLRSVERREIPDNPKSIESVMGVIQPMYHDYIKTSYPLVDIDSHSRLIKPSQLEKLKSDMVDVIDIDGLHSISIEGLNLLELL